MGSYQSDVKRSCHSLMRERGGAPRAAPPATDAALPCVIQCVQREVLREGVGANLDHSLDAWNEPIHMKGRFGQERKRKRTIQRWSVQPAINQTVRRRLSATLLLERLCTFDGPQCGPTVQHPTTVAIIDHGLLAQRPTPIGIFLSSDCFNLSPTRLPVAPSSQHSLPHLFLTDSITSQASRPDPSLVGTFSWAHWVWETGCFP